MGRRASACVVVLCAAVVMVGAQNGPKDDEQFQAAQRLLEVVGDFPAALEAFRTIESRPGVDQGLRARALFGMAESHRMLGQAEATRLYQRIREEFGDQKEVAQAATARLTALQASARPLPQFAARLEWTPDDDLHPSSIGSDGRWMAVDRGFGAEMLVRDMLTGGLRSISPDADPPALSRDGRLVAYNFFGRDHLSAPVPEGEDAGGLRVTVNEPGGATRVVRHNSSSPGVRYFSALAFTPDNTALFVFIVHQDWTRQLARISLQTGHPDVLKSLDWRTRGGPRDDEPALSPDGRLIAYSALRTSPSSNDARIDSTDRDIYILAADASRETVVVSGASVNSSPKWSPDGSRLFFLSNRGGDGAHLWSIAVRDGRAADDPILVRRLTGETRLLGMVEGGGLYFMRAPDPRDDIYIADYDADSGIISGAKRLTAGIADSTVNPTWSPDGRFVAFRRAIGVGEGFQTGIRSVETGAEVAYPTGLPVSGVRAPVLWLHGGRRLLEWCPPAVCTGAGGMYRVDLDTREIRLQIPAPDSGRTRLTVLRAISRDDRMLYSVLRTPSGRGSQIGAFDMETGEMRGAFEVPGLASINGIALIPSGRTLAVIGTPLKPVETHEVRRQFEQQLARIDVDGGNHQILHPAFLIAVAGWAQTLTWTRDGRHVLFGESGEFATPEFGVNRVMRIAATGGSPAFTGLGLQSDGTLDFDPTGRRLAFDSREVFAPELWVLEPVAKR